VQFLWSGTDACLIIRPISFTPFSGLGTKIWSRYSRWILYEL